MTSFFFGTSSWSEPSWKGVFYPADLPQGEFLTFYATRFRTVEADVTYYRIPSKAMVAGWARKTPPGFVLSAKFPRSIVHGGESALPDGERLLMPDKVGGEVEAFLEAMGSLGEKCGPLILQFPYFNRKVFKSPEPFFERLDAFLERLPESFRYGVEIRNRDWLGAPLVDLLRRHKVALVLVDLVYLPHPLSFEFDFLPTDFAYVRLIGDRKAVESRTETFDRVVVDQTPRLEQWAKLLRRLDGRAERVLVYANNHYAGYAPGTIENLAVLADHPIQPTGAEGARR